MWYRHLKSVFPNNFCEHLIEKAEDIGFKEADVRFYKGTKRMENVRNNSRIEFDDNALIMDISKKIVSVMVNDFPYSFHNPKLEKNVSFTRFNEHLRFYRYFPGEYFKPHKDGGYQVGEQESLITVLVYLNDTDGGETVLMPDGPSHTESFIKVSPKAGDVLLFNHPAWHEGKPVNSGVKYVLRSDIFYTM